MKAAARIAPTRATAPTPLSALVRKPILLTPVLVSKAETIAEAERISLSEVMRRALEAYNPGGASDIEQLDTLADILTQSTDSAIRAVDEAHHMLQETRRLMAKSGIVL